MAESRDDPCDNLTVTVLTDQHLRPDTTVPVQHHQLLRMPKSKNRVASFLIQCVDRFVPASLALYRTGDASNERRPHRGQHRKFQPFQES